MHKWLMFVMLIGASALGVGTMIHVVDQHAKENAPEDTGGKPQLKLTATNWQLDQPEYTVKAGETVKVSLNMKEGIHEINISGYNVTLDRNNPTADVTFDKPGTYELRCQLPCGQGHATMASKLIVQ